MAQRLVLGGGAVIAALMVTTAAYADVTAEQVWNNWKAMVEAQGQTISTGSETKSGDTLVVRDITSKVDIEGGMATGTLAELDLREQGDGTVAVTLSPEYPIDLSMTPKGGKLTEMHIVLNQSGMKMVVSGSPGDMTYEFDAPTIGVKLAGMKADGKDIALDVDVGMTGAKGTYVIKGIDTRTVASSVTADALTYRVSAKNPDGDGTFDLNGKMTGLTGKSDATLVGKMDMADLNAALQAGFAVDANFAYSASQGTSDFAQKGQTMHSETSASGGALNVALDKTRLNYGVAGKDVKVAVSGSQIPLPTVNVELAEIAANLLMPVAKSDTPQDFGLLVKLVGLKVNDEIWGMFDPGTVLPHDPATLVVDLAGKANWLFDIFDPAQQKMPHAMPGQVHALDVKTLDLAVAGAELTGQGGFTFDNSDMTTFNGVPKPTGSVDLKLVGGNGLIDKLVKMGLVPADQASGARMMLGLFARPGTGDDTLVSKIEITPNGEVMANGQRLQ